MEPVRNELECELSNTPNSPKNSSSSSSSEIEISPAQPEQLSLLPTILQSLLTRAGPNPEKPTFDGKKPNPRRFLSAVNKAYGRTLHLNEGQLLDVASECLRGNARQSSTIYKKNWKSFGDFKCNFLKTFWSESRQLEIRHQIATARYCKERGTMLAHFSYYVDLASMLTTPLPEAMLISEIMHHFPEQVQILWALQGKRTALEAAEFLLAQNVPCQNHGTEVGGRNVAGKNGLNPGRRPNIDQASGPSKPSEDRREMHDKRYKPFPPGRFGYQGQNHQSNRSWVRNRNPDPQNRPPRGENQATGNKSAGNEAGARDQV